MHRNVFLDLVGTQIHSGRPKVPEGFNYTVLASQKDDLRFVQIGFRTRGCRYTVLFGGCTMCDYWISSPVLQEDMVSYVQQALAALDREPDILLLNPLGSVFDEWEVPRDARLALFRLFRSYENTRFIFETHAATMSERALKDCFEILGDRKVEVEFGLESANNWILKYCINKHMDLKQAVRAVGLIIENSGPQESVEIQ